MTIQKKCIATNSLCVLLAALCGAPALAGTAVGTVIRANGPLLLQRADGTSKAIAVDSFVEQGDTLVTEKSTYAQLKFADNSEAILTPGTQLKIEVLAFNSASASNMDTILSLARGTVQLRTGGAQQAQVENIRLVMHNLLNPVATVTLDRKAGTAFVAQYIAASAASQLAARPPVVLLASAESGYRSDAPLMSAPKSWDAPQLLAQLPPPVPGARAPGLYIQVLDGIINLANKGGSQSFAAGQFGYTASLSQPPIVVPKNPGIQFAPPPAFQSSAGPRSSAPSGQPATIDCVVR